MREMPERGAIKKRLDELEVIAAAEGWSAQRLYQARNRALGLCHSCGDKATHGRLCAKHAKKHAKRRQNAGASKARCLGCGKLGHYRKTCPNKVQNVVRLARFRSARCTDRSTWE